MAKTINAGQGATPTELSLQYTRGTGANYPTNLLTSVATQSGVGTGVTQVNGFSGGVTITSSQTQPGITVTNGTGTAAGTVTLAILPIVPNGTTEPTSPAPVLGQLFFRTDTSHLEVWNGTAWVGTHLT